MTAASGGGGQGAVPAPRRAVVEWSDPRAVVEGWRGRTGAEYVAAVACGDIPVPPLVSLLGYDALEERAGSVTILATPGEMHYNAIGTVHGGYAATLLDSAMTLAVMTTLPADTGCTTLDIQVRYVRPLVAGSGQVRCIGTVLHSGSRTATVEGRLFDAAGRLCAHGTSACLLVPRDPAQRG